jgi:hypothetical protein
MDTQDIQSIELEYLQLSDYQALKTAMISAYPSMPDAYWKEASSLMGSPTVPRTFREAIG